MSNMVSVYEAGRAGRNFGITTGIPPLDRSINGIQRKMSVGIAAAPKGGKTSLVDFGFVISPYLFMLQEGRLDNINWIYFSYEIDRINKEFKFAAYFMYLDYGVFDVEFKGTIYLMSKDYLMGKLRHKNLDGSQEQVIVTPEHEQMLREIYNKRIIPLFGGYDRVGNKVSSGKIDLIEEPENPTGMLKYCKAYFARHGRFTGEDYTTMDDRGTQVTRSRERGYIPSNPDLYTIIVTDHIRKLLRERGFTMKENIDKWLEYTTFLRNRCEGTFINVCHSNRGISNIDRLKFAGEYVFPTADDVKDTGNLAEESTVLMTLFNPNDEKYNLKRHFGIELKDHPNYRSLHITESRDTEAPVHIQTNMYGGVNLFTGLGNRI